MPKWLRLTASFSGLVIAPIAVEFLISYIKTEPYNLVRAAQVLIAAVATLSLILAVRSLSRQLRLALELGLLALGSAVVVVASLPLIVDVAATASALTFSTIGLGVLVSVVAGLSVYADRKGLDLRLAGVPPVLHSEILG